MSDDGPRPMAHPTVLVVVIKRRGGGTGRWMTTTTTNAWTVDGDGDGIA